LVKLNGLELDIETREANKILDSVSLYRWDERITKSISYGIEFTFNIPVYNQKTYLKDSIQRQLAINKLGLSQRELLSELEGTERGFRKKIDQYDALRDSDFYKTLKSLKKLLS